MRENLYNTPGNGKLREDHYGHKFTYGTDFVGDSLIAWEKEKAEKEKAASEKSETGPPIVDGKVGPVVTSTVEVKA